MIATLATDQNPKTSRCKGSLRFASRRCFGGFGVTHGSEAHTRTHARVDWPIFLAKLTHVANICVYMCVGLWSVCSGVVAPGRRGVAITVMMLIMMPWRSRERPKSLAGSKEAKKLNVQRKNAKGRKRRPWKVRHAIGSHPPDRAGRR